MNITEEQLQQNQKKFEEKISNQFKYTMRSLRTSKRNWSLATDGFGVCSVFIERTNYTYYVRTYVPMYVMLIVCCDTIRYVLLVCIE